MSDGRGQSMGQIGPIGSPLLSCMLDLPHNTCSGCFRTHTVCRSWGLAEMGAMYSMDSGIGSPCSRSWTSQTVYHTIPGACSRVLTTYDTLHRWLVQDCITRGACSSQSGTHAALNACGYRASPRLAEVGTMCTACPGSGQAWSTDPTAAGMGALMSQAGSNLSLASLAPLWYI